MNPSLERTEATRRGTRRLVLALLALTAGCEHVEFYEKARFASPLMAFDDDSTRVHAMQKVFYSREASVGGIGSTAGGGCGCTN